MAKEAYIIGMKMRSMRVQLWKSLKSRTLYNDSSMSLNNLYKSVSISSKDGYDNLFSYLKSEIVRWLENAEISGKYASPILTYISQIKTYFGKLREFFVYWFVKRKTLSHFFDICFHFPNIYISKTCVKQGNYEIRKLGLRDGFDSPNMWHL